MNALVFRCPQCHQPFQVLAQYAGEIVACPRCETTVQIPDPSSEPPSQLEATPETEPVAPKAQNASEQPIADKPSGTGETATDKTQSDSADRLKAPNVPNDASASRDPDRPTIKPTIAPVPTVKSHSPLTVDDSASSSSSDVPQAQTQSQFQPQSVDHLLPPKFVAIDPALFYRRHQDGQQVLLPSENGSGTVVDNRIVRIEHNGRTYELISSPRYDRLQKAIVTNLLALVICGLVIAIVMTMLKG